MKRIMMMMMMMMKVMMMMMMTYTRDVCGGKEKTSTATCRWWERPEYDASQVEFSNLDIDSQHFEKPKKTISLLTQLIFGQSQGSFVFGRSLMLPKVEVEGTRRHLFQIL